MKITLIGTGCGTPATLTEEGKHALWRADVIFGAARVLNGLPDASKQTGDSTREKMVEAKPRQICDLLACYIEDSNIENAAIALSGDSGFYSGARILKERILERFGDICPVEIIPGISSVQMLAARLGIPWQDWNLVSAHGVGCDPVYEIMKGRETFFLTGGKYTADVICRELAEAGLGELRVTVGENLSYLHEDNNVSTETGHVDSFSSSAPDTKTGHVDSFSSSAPDTRAEHIDSFSSSDSDTRTEHIDSFSASARDTKTEYIFTGTASECAERTFSDLAVLLVDTKTQDGKRLIQPRKPAGMPDDVFTRGKVPMTKMEVRCVILGKMAVSENDVVWDIGAGTGSVSVELAMQARQVWAVERRDEAVELIRENREKFGRWNLRIVQGEAPMDLKELPDPDAVFVGGSGGHLGEILHEVWRRNENARICISATLLETLQESLAAFAEREIEPDIVQIAFTRSEKVGGRHMMRAGNPIYVITGSCKQ